MKTRDRILHTSLALFNQEGEEPTTTIDIANELDISPGNLYYHFKGKDQIIAELYHQYHTALSSTLRAPVQAPLSDDPRNVEKNWYYLYVLLEEMYQYRFLYYNLSNLLQRYPEIRRQFRRLVELKHSALNAICQTLMQQAVIDTGEERLQGLVENLTLHLTYWLSYDQLDFYRDCQDIYANMLAVDA